MEFCHPQRWQEPIKSEYDVNGINIYFNLGQILTALKQTEKAVSAYKTCYQLDTSQKDVLQTICELLVELPIDPGT